jgi:hypothetical protein
MASRSSVSATGFAVNGEAEAAPLRIIAPQARLLGRFDPKGPYCVLRLRLQHPRWGPNRLRYHLGKHPSLRGLPLPSEAEIGRYLHQ